ncbi:hypothetical protein HN51_052108 [Arachis hypogaea]
MTYQFFSDTWGYQPPLEMIAEVGDHQPLQSQPHPQVWTWEENKAYESVIANCFQDAIHNRWETVATRLPGKNLAQLQDCFLKLMTKVNGIKNGYPENMIIMIPMPAIPLEHSPLSIPSSMQYHHHYRLIGLIINITGWRQWRPWQTWQCQYMLPYRHQPCQGQKENKIDMPTAT